MANTGGIWRAGILAILIAAGSIVAACSGPSSERGQSRGGVSENVITSSDPITTGSDLLVYDKDDDQTTIRVDETDNNAGGVAASGPTNLSIVTTVELGSFLADGAGRTMYLFTNDRPFDSTCDGVCQQNWPPVTTLGMPQAGEGVDPGLVGTMLRADGAEQVTYNGWPLYYSVDDTEPGSAYGQGVNGLWFVVSQTGQGVVLE